MSKKLIKQDIDKWLDDVDYTNLDEGTYVPSSFALQYLAFIKLVNGDNPEPNKTPAMHLAMLDKLTTDSQYIVNLCARGVGKALSLKTRIPTPTGWTNVRDIQPGDELFDEDGKVAKVLCKSEVFNKPMYRLYLADNRTLDVSEDHINVILRRKRRGITREELTTKELLGIKLFAERKITAKNPKGREHLVWIPNAKPLELPEKDLPIDPYTLGLILGDGSINADTGLCCIHTSHEDLEHYKTKIPYELGKSTPGSRGTGCVSTSILGLGSKLRELGLNDKICHTKFVPREYLRASIKQRMALLQGLLDTGGYVCGSVVEYTTVSPELMNMVSDLVGSLGGSCRSNAVINAAGNLTFRMNISLKECPVTLPRKVAKFKGKSPMATKVALEKIEMIDDEPSQCLYVSSPKHTFLAGGYVVTHNTTLFAEYLFLYLAVFGEIPGFGTVDGILYIADSMENGAKNCRKNIETRYWNSPFLQEWIPEAKFTDTYIEFKNKDGKRLGIKLFGATTGIRGTKIFAKRPQLVVADDLLSDEAAKSKTILQLIKDTLYKGVNHALDPTQRKIVLNGTPFNKNDPIIEAVESGAWEVNVWPICEKFPCTKEEFRGAWPDRFSYEFIQNQYETAVLTGQLSSFNQELMLRISSDEDRLVADDDIRWYSRKGLLENKQNFNFYITTDFATSSKQSADYSVISVWAYNANGDWYWVDGVCAKQTMDKNVNDLFRLVLEYKPLEVGVEITGQQGGFVSWLQQEQMHRNIWFNFSKMPNSNLPGIRPSVDKLSRFNVVVPWFKAGKFYFPTELKASNIMGTFLQQLRLATRDGLKGHDDCLDTISMLGYLRPWKPSMSSVPKQDSQVYEDDSEDFQADNTSKLSSYVV